MRRSKIPELWRRRKDGEGGWCKYKIAFSDWKTIELWWCCRENKTIEGGELTELWRRKWTGVSKK